MIDSFRLKDKSVIWTYKNTQIKKCLGNNSSAIICLLIFSSHWIGSDCCSVGRVVASTTRGPWFESSHCKFNIEHLFTVNCIEKMKIKNKRPGMDHIKKSWAIILGGKNCRNCLKRLDYSRSFFVIFVF